MRRQPGSPPIEASSSSVLARISARLSAALHVQADQRLGVGRAQIEAPVRELDAEPVRVVHATRRPA